MMKTGPILHQHCMYARNCGETDGKLQESTINWDIDIHEKENVLTMNLITLHLGKYRALQVFFLTQSSLATFTCNVLTSIFWS